MPERSRTLGFVDSLPELTITAWLRFGSIRRLSDSVPYGEVLEVGAGQGGLGSWLARRRPYTGVEPDVASRSVAQRRLAEVGSRSRLMSDLDEVGDERFALVCAFEVLEHIEDDRGALRDWRDRLPHNGHLLMSVPAHASTFGPSDEFVGHFRRYDRAQLRTLLETEGFTIERWYTYGAGLGQLIERVRNAIVSRREMAPSVAERSASSGRLFQPGGRGRAILNFVIAAPFRVLQWPFSRTDVGMGYVVLARRIDGSGLTTVGDASALP